MVRPSLPTALAALTLAAAILTAGCADGPAAPLDEPATATRHIDVPRPHLDALDDDVAARLEESRARFDQWRGAHSATADPGQAARVYGDLGKLYLVYAFNDAAAAALRNASTLAATFESIYLEGVAWQRQGALDRAAEAFDAALEQRPDDVPALLRRGAVAWESGDPETAAALYGRAVTLAPDSAAALYGLALTKRRAPAEAVPLLEAALASDPSADAVHHALGLALRDLGRPEEAAVHLAQAGQRRPEAPDPLFDRLGNLLQDADIHIAQGTRAMTSGDVDNALAHFQRAVQLEPENAEALHNLGAALGRLRRHPEALAHLQRAAELDPENAGVHFDLATSFANLGRLEDAARAFTAAVEHDPGDREARRRRAQVWAALGRVDGARSDLRALLEDYPSDAASRALLDGLPGTP
ncbi:MAG: tetratricopeptide repeat protein [Acidobacteriota bacterium]